MQWNTLPRFTQDFLLDKSLDDLLGFVEYQWTSFTTYDRDIFDIVKKYHGELPCDILPTSGSLMDILVYSVHTHLMNCSQQVLDAVNWDDAERLLDVKGMYYAKHLTADAFLEEYALLLQIDDDAVLELEFLTRHPSIVPHK